MKGCACIKFARSFFALNDHDNSLKAINNGLQVHPDNFDLLKAGSVFSIEGKHDYDAAQSYINRMLELDPDNNKAR